MLAPMNRLAYRCGRMTVQRGAALNQQRVGSQLMRPLALGNQQNLQVTQFSSDSKDRPISPHIMIYSWPLAAISSITTRVTGTVLTIGCYGLAYGALVGGDMPGMMSCLGSSAIGPLVKASVAFPVVYHYLAGLRVFYWEKNPEGLNPETQKQSSLGVYGVSGALTLIAMVL